MKKNVFFTDAPLPPYSIRRSKRARRIGLRVQPGRGLEVVLPLHADAGCVPEILVRHGDWIRKALVRTASKQEEFAGQAGPCLPASFAIKGGEEIIELCLHGLGRRPAGKPCAKCLVFTGSLAERPPVLPACSAIEKRADVTLRAPLHSEPEQGLGPWKPSPPRRRVTLADMCAGREAPEACASTALERLRAWVRREAEAYLGDMLGELAGLCAASHSGLTIRFQRTRWGSCSSAGRINLNASLLFLPRPLTRYILIHELCHLRRMDHSERFWKEVFTVEPNALVYDKAMRGAWKHVPSWVMGRTAK